MFIINLKTMRLRAILGVLPHERKLRQHLVIHVRFALKHDPTQMRDVIEDTVSYADIHDEVIAFVKARRANLLETLVSEVVDLILQKPGIAWAKVEIEKPEALRFAESVSVSLRRDAGAESEQIVSRPDR